ncbi:MAG: hypothetical protein OXD48_13235 [Litoreibacter sp.]|nr:hypothetical protein [Litoreibacter sp.]
MAECLGETLLSSMQHADIVLFLARLGDQFRFSTLPDGPRILVCFAQSSEMLASSFGTAHYNAFCEAKRAVDLRMMQAREITITCPAGTEVKGHVPDDIAKATDTSLIRFPMSVFSPVLAREFSGRVALGDFLTGTGVHYYESYTVEFCEPVFAYLERGRIAGFEGSARDVAKANAHYDRVSMTFGLDRNAVHSWHAGIHPGCGFHLDIRGAYEKWGGAAFGNPRVLHFHTCGAEPPGEISWNLFDPTIMVDWMALWENGTFCLDRLDEGPGILAQYPCAAAAFAQPDREVGFQDVN